MKAQKLISWKQVSDHTTETNLWLVIEDWVYDLSDYMTEHPGGPIVLENRGGCEATMAFQQANHSINAKENVMTKYRIGKIDRNSPVQQWQKEEKSTQPNILITYYIFHFLMIIPFYDDQNVNVYKNMLNKFISKQYMYNNSNIQMLNRKQYSHLVQIIVDKFLNPYKILYMLDRQQADKFKRRNQNTSCCASNTISIPQHQLTTNEKYLQMLLSPEFILKQLPKILQQLANSFQNVLRKGKKDSLQITKEVEKYLIDQVLLQGCNLYILKQLSNQIKEKSQCISSGINHWATPNTWKQQYPQHLLNHINQFEQFVKNDFSIVSNLHTNISKLHKELQLLEIDGHFQALLYQNPQIRNDTKILNTPQHFIDTSQTVRFPALTELILQIHSLPFQINMKINTYCTVIQNQQISYYAQQVIHHFQQDKENQYSLIMPIGGQINCSIKKLDGSQCINQILKEGNLLITNNKKNIIQLISNNKKIFIARSWINCVKKIQ